MAMALLKGRNTLWRMVVEAKYESMWRGWCSGVVHGSYGVGVSKIIRRSGADFCRFVRYKGGG